MATNFRWKGVDIPPVTKNIIIINVILWVTTILFKQKGIIDLNDYLSLHFWLGSKFHVHQLFTYMFMHDSRGFSTGITHIFFNMFSLWMIGSLLERVMGVKRYLIFYLFCGIGAGLVQELVWHISDGGITEDYIMIVNESGNVVDQVLRSDFFNMLVTVGASGAVFGILLAFAVLFPNVPIYIMFVPIPIKAKWAVIGFAIMELFFGVTSVMSGVAHFAHLGGMLFAFILLLYWKNKGLFFYRKS